MAATKSNDTTSKLIMILIAACIMLAAYMLKECHTKVQSEKQVAILIQALSDTVKYHKSKDSINHASITTIQTENASLFTKLVVRDIDIQNLQKAVIKYKSVIKKPGSSVVTIGSNTIIKSTVVTEVSESKDLLDRYPTLETDTSQYFTWHSIYYPIYKAQDTSSKWMKYTIVATKDSTTLKIKLVNEYSVILGYDKGIPFADVSNANPFDSIKTLRSWQVSMPKEKKWIFGFQVGSGLNLTNVKPAFFIGVGITRTFFKF